MDTYVAFIDFFKAYDRINRSMLWKTLYKNGLKQNATGITSNIFKC